MGLSHFLCKRNFLDGCRPDRTLSFFLFTNPDCSKERTHTNAGCSKVIYFINLQCRIDFIGTGQDIGDLICSHGIQSAAKGVELDEIQIFCCFYIVCRSVQTGMIHPLIHDVQRPFYRIQVGNRILRQHGDIVGCDHLRQTVVHFRIDMIRTSSKDDAAVSSLI